MSCSKDKGLGVRMCRYDSACTAKGYTYLHCTSLYMHLRMHVYLLCVCVYVYMRMHAYMCLCICAYVHVFLCVCVYCAYVVCVLVCLWCACAPLCTPPPDLKGSWMPTRAHSLTHALARTHARACASMRKLAQNCTCARARAHATTATVPDLSEAHSVCWQVVQR